MGRYVITARVGSGAMGVVFAAEDPKLDRRVAIKILLPARMRSAATRERLMAEARALARLNHANIVAVYDVGSFERATFLAMELVDGRTLTQWRREQSPSWRATVETFVQAGRGLAAVHRAGLVHRDVKPDNIMIDRAGRVCVMDFGLARQSVDLRASSDDIDPSRSGPDTSVDTREHGLVGTPAYVAPEQLAGLSADASSDQFSFCVALYETLWGQHPFGRENLAALALAVTTGQVRDPPRVPSVPARLRRAVLRGLAPRGDDRHPSMEALVAELEQVLRRSGRMGLLALGATSIGTSAWVLFSSASACTGAGERLHETWNAARAVELRAGLDGGRSAHARSDRIVPRLNAWAQTWTNEYSEACTATRARGGQSEEAMDQRMACLDRRRKEFAATIELLSDAPDDGVLRHAGEIVGDLPDVRICRDARELAPRVDARASDEATQIDAVHDALARMRVLARAGSYAQAHALASAALRDAKTLGVPPLLAEVQLETGLVRQALGEHAAAERSMEEAYATAIAHKLDALALAAANALVRIVGAELARYDDGLRWAAVAGALVERLDAGASRRADLLDATGLIEYRRGRFEPAQKAHARALALRETMSDAPIAIASTRANLARTDAALGRYEAGYDALARVVNEREAVFGPEHPEVATALNDLGSIALEVDRVDEAAAHFLRALAIRQAALGSTHASLASVLGNVASTLRVRGALDEALAMQREAVAISIDRLGPDHPDTADASVALAMILEQMGRRDEALARARAALRSQERLLGSTHPALGISHGLIGRLLAAKGNRDDAGAHLDTAIAILDRTLGADHPAVGRAHLDLAIAFAAEEHWQPVLAHASAATRTLQRTLGARHRDICLPLSWQGRALLRLGRAREAVAALQRAKHLLSPSVTPSDRGATHLALAQAWLEGEGDHARAYRAATRALIDADDEGMAAAYRWLRAHPRN